jgi:septum site-determining protein MinC
MADFSASLPTFTQNSSTAHRDVQVRFKNESGRLLLLLPPEQEAHSANLTWPELWQQFRQHLDAGERFWQPDTPVHLIARDRLLDGRQLQAIADTLAQAQLHLKRIYTSRRQTAVAAATAGYSVEQQGAIAQLSQPPSEAGQPLADPLYLQTTLRSGSEVRHNGTVILLGDANPGSTIMASGDILIWGRLRGVAHAGAQGNLQCRIMALQMQPTQLRIASHIARAPASAPAEYYPEVAYVTSEGTIRITKATEFIRI